MVASGNVGAAFGLVCVAGAASAVGATVVFFPSIVKRTSRRFLAASLGLSAGVMLYISFVEILYKSLEGFERADIDENRAYLYTTLSFFGGVLVMKMIDGFVSFLGRYREPLRRDIEEDIEITWNENEDASEAANEARANEAHQAALAPQHDALHYCLGCTADPIAELEHWRELAERELEEAQRPLEDPQEGQDTSMQEQIHKQEVSRRKSSMTMRTMKSSMTTVNTHAHDLNDPENPAGQSLPSHLVCRRKSSMDLHYSFTVAPPATVDEEHGLEPTNMEPRLHEEENYIPSGTELQQEIDDRVIEKLYRSKLPVPAEISIGASSKTVPTKNQGSDQPQVTCEPEEERRNSVVIHIENVARPQEADGFLRAPTRIEVNPKEEKRKLLNMGLGTALAIFLHNFPEGLATFMAALEDPSVGAVLAVAIGIHNIPEGMFVALPIYYATGNRKKAFLWGSLSGISEPIAALLGWLVFADAMTDTVYGALFGIVGGIMTMISLKELIPTAHRYDPEDTVVSNCVVVGMAVLALSLVLFRL